MFGVQDELRWTIRRADSAAVAVLFALAFAVRIGMILSARGGLTGDLGGDSAAYYAGADALVHGRLPYRDFVLLHPPLLDLVLTPFAAIGAVTSDHGGFVAAALAGELCGAVSAVLVVVVARRFGLDRRASFVAGGFYAVWYGAIASDVGIRLEGFATLLCLLGLVALTGEKGRRNTLLGGAAFGAAASVKIWGIVPVLVLAAWLFAARSTRRSVPAFAAGAAIAITVVCGPFFVAAPRSMWHMVVTDQLTRLSSHRERLQKMLGLQDVWPSLHGPAFVVVVVLVLAALAAVIVTAVRVRSTRVLVVLAVVEVVVLAASPSYYMNYAGFAAAALALTVGAAAHRTGVARRHWTAAPIAVVVLGATGLCVGALIEVPTTVTSRPYPPALLARAVDGVHCPTPDSPIVLIVTDTLSRTLADGCPNWIDVTGRVYDVDKAPQGADYPRTLNAHWQRDLHRYLLSGGTVILYRRGLGAGAPLLHEIWHLPLIGKQDGFRAYRVPH